MAISSYQPFPIAEFKTGLYDYTQSWVRPLDAYEPLENAYVYRGILQKRNGSRRLGNSAVADGLPIMGIMQWVNPDTGALTLVAASEDYLYKFVLGATEPADAWQKVVGVSNSQFWSGTVAPGAFGPVPVFWTTATPGTVTITITSAGSVVATSTDNAATPTATMSANGWITAGTFTFATGILNLTLSGAATGFVTITITTTLSSSSPYFTGTIANFFNSTNWQPTSTTTFIPSTAYLYMTNNVDPVTLFDGTNLSRPGFYTNSASTQYISKALDVKVYNNRLLLLRPKLNNGTNSDNQGVFFSALFSPFNFINDVAGNGGAISAATSDFYMSSEFLRDELICNFSESTWDLQRTGISIAPFSFKRLNDSKKTNSPYGTIDFDDVVRSVGATGLTQCDGVNVSRYDQSIIDFYETVMQQQYYNQVFGIRYDNLNQAWMLYPSSTASPVIDNVAPGSDCVLVFNFFENSFCTYRTAIPMTCLGAILHERVTTWANVGITWDQGDATWSSYGNEFKAPILLGGTTDGRILWMDQVDSPKDGMVFGSSVTGSSFSVSIVGKKWNPFATQGQKTQFGYVDVFYSVEEDLSGVPVELTLKFYADYNPTAVASRPLTLDGPAGSSYAWKRIYLNIIAEFVQMEIDPQEDAPFQITGLVLWARPAGRFTSP